MKLVIFTLVKNGMPWITLHYPELRKLTIPWEWHVVEGTALPENCTSWCNRMRPGLSDDGTTGYLDSLIFDYCIFLYRREVWHGKVEMANAPLRYLTEPCVLLQMDSDELWKAEDLENMCDLLLGSDKPNCAYFQCRYFVGPNIVVSSKGLFGDRDYEWLRAWKWEPGMRFQTHEPPVMVGPKPLPIPKETTAYRKIFFDHMAYATEAQVKFKSDYYGSPQNPLGGLYRDSVEGWRRLQKNTVWPVKLRDFLPFVNDDSEAVRL